MTDAQRLRAVRALHTIIYVVMSIGTLAILYAGLTGAQGLWLWIALGLLAIETAVFVVNGLRCPLTASVARYSAGARVSDTYFPESITRHTLKVFGPLLTIGVLLVAARLWLALA